MEQRYLFAPTSQFYFCGIPLKLDSSTKCFFNCQYCFSNLRGGNHSATNSIFESSTIERYLSGKCRGVMGEFYNSRMPIHIGGMSDPFATDCLTKVTHNILEQLSASCYPALISTKNPQGLLKTEHPEYYKENLVVQVSFSSSDEMLINKIELSAPCYSSRIEAIKELSSMGFRVTARIQPFIPCLLDNVKSVLIPQLIGAGVDHIILEHLKLPLEKENRRKLISVFQDNGIELKEYENYGEICGREIVLAKEAKLDAVCEIRKLCNQYGVTFGSGDDGLYHLSNTDCCCGVDKYFPKVKWFKNNLTNIIKNSSSEYLTSDLLNEYECPKSSIAMYINSHSRTVPVTTYQTLLLKKWNTPGSANAPDSFYGIKYCNQTDNMGNAIYKNTLWRDSDV